MTKSEYAQYLASEHWQVLRRRVIEMDPRCQKCQMPRWLAIIAYDQDLHVHHLTYANVGSESLDELQTLVPSLS